MSTSGEVYTKLGLIIRKWDLRSWVLITLFLQTLLLLVAPFRKRTSNGVLLGALWVAYILSDWASNYAVALIQATKVDNEQPDSPGFQSEILMFWAPFLVLHIGGADSISALSSIDNELWSRFAIQLATMTYGIGNAFYRSFLETRLRVPVLLMFVAGLTKYVERIWCLYQARFSSLKESLLEEKTKSSNKSLDLDCHPYELSDAKMVRDAYSLFESFKAVFVDLQVDPKNRKKSKEYFQRRNPGEAFRVVEIELNFYYDLFYSKGPVIRQGLGRLLRLICMMCEVITLVLWVRIDKRNIMKFDVYATYALLLGAVARDFTSLVMMIFSDWSVASVVRNYGDSKLINTWLSLRKKRWDGYSCSEEAPLSILVLRALLSRWSESIYQLDFIALCYDQTLDDDEKVSKDIGVDFFLKKLKSAPKMWFTNALRDFIFQELTKRASQDNIALSRGQWTLENMYNNGPGGAEELLCLSRTYVAEKTFDQSLLIWHIATTLCTITDDEEESLEEEHDEFSDVLSDYMLYLLLRSPDMMLEVAAMGDKTFEDTRRTAKGAFHLLYVNDIEARCNIEAGCRGMLRMVGQEERLVDLGNSVWYDACRLTIRLKELDEKQVVNMWEVISKVWVEMLCYGAARCSPSAHAAQLANGGELITLVWLLMEHLGLGKKG